MRWLKALFLSITVSFAFAVSAEVSSDKELKIEHLATGLSIPWGMAVLPDNSLLITQRGNALSHLNLDSGEITDISGLPGDVRVEGQGGLFDVQLSPDYESTGWIFFSYNKDVNGQGATTLSRAKLQDKQLIDWQDLLVTQSRTDNNVHYGGRITFDTNGHVFLSIGDRGERDSSQDLSSHNGSVLRLNLDGKVPIDNPFVGQNNVLPEIWSYGHRNPQGLFFNPDTKQLWVAEHGPRGGDEINLVQPGNNYGWPVISYGKEYWAPLDVGKGTHKAGMEQPVKVYVPSIATSSLIQYRGTALPGWQGKLLIGALKQQHLNVIALGTSGEAIDEQKRLRSLNSRIRNVIETPQGALIIGTDAGDIYRITATDD
jgi:glucose/arabinose dehydrogenase